MKKKNENLFANKKPLIDKNFYEMFFFCCNIVPLMIIAFEITNDDSDTKL